MPVSVSVQLQGTSILNCSCISIGLDLPCTWSIALLIIQQAQLDNQETLFFALTANSSLPLPRRYPLLAPLQPQTPSSAQPTYAPSHPHARAQTTHTLTPHASRPPPTKPTTLPSSTLPFLAGISTRRARRPAARRTASRCTGWQAARR
ncbi:hypothetical protein NEOLEDRAFT_565455 [Neolentinus lepideus HHB14362 ss-1]|uniref:Uncharacterized protein n=1 Tax=Neolentinus lepideus HHB14362 ss-1 TaxID=1314782 RepID=A0A165R395_9AGAM|nr:hypothetical protein NEOLEDRAFT_565455 [Neolentinus lepideus HHB14362 ss-1]